MISLTAIFVIFVFTVIVWRKRKFYILSWKVGGPSIAWPVVGNIGYFMNQKAFIANGIALCMKFPKWYRIWCGPYLLIVLNEPQHAETVLKSPYALDKGNIYRMFTIVFGGDGIVSSKGDEWKSHRKFLNPTVQHFSLLNSFPAIFNVHLRKLVATMNKNVSVGEIDIYPVIEGTALDTVCETTFGGQESGDEIIKEQFLNSVNALFNIIGLFCSKPWYHIHAIFRMTNDYQRMETSRAIVREYASKIIHRKAKEYENRLTVSTEDGIDQKVQNNFIDECLRLSMDTKFFSHEDLILESITMLLGAFETTSVTVSYVLLMLAMHPDCQQKVFEELRTIFPDQSSDITLTDLSNLHYTSNVVKETMRLNPAVPIMSRVLQKDMKFDDVVFPAGLDVAIPLINIHRNQSVWGPDAEKFNPDNFLPENMAKRHPCAYMAFSLGARNCIGYKYGSMVVRFFVCWLIRNFRFSTSMRMEDIQYKMCTTLKMFNGHMIEVHRREVY